MNYYDILELSNNAATENIKKNYRRLALIYHPDRSNSKLASSEKFILITEAYTVLVNPLSREKYDVSLKFTEYMEKDSKSDRPEFSDNLSELYDNFLSTFGLDKSTVFNKLGLDQEKLETLHKFTELTPKQARVIFEMTLDELFSELDKSKSKSKSDYYKTRVDTTMKEHGQFQSQDQDISDVKETMNNTKTSIQVDNTIRMTEYRNLTVKYELEDHYLGDFTKIVTLKSNNTIKNLEINSQIPSHSIELFLDNTFYLLDIKCQPLDHDLFYLGKGRNNLVHEIQIPLNAYVNGFYYELDVFGKTKYLFFRKPYLSNKFYQLDNQGLIDHVTGQRGKLFIHLTLDRLKQDDLQSIKLIQLEERDMYTVVEPLSLSELLQ